jgi:hypothetical protein
MSKRRRICALGSVSLTAVVLLSGTAPVAASSADSLVVASTGSALSLPVYTYSHLDGVAAISATDAWAVGVDGQKQKRKGLIEHWDGTAWTRVSNPVGPGWLTSVSAVASKDVWAVGNANGRLPLIEHWDGTAWTAVTAAPVPFGSWFTGVAAVSADDVWAVGARFNAKYKTRTLVEHWDGTRWTQVPCPSPGPGGYHGSVLTSVSAVSSDDVWAVGDYEPDVDAQEKTLTVHWDGTAWSRVASPNPGGAAANLLLSVSATSASDVWTAGYYLDHGKSSLIEHWDGTRWSRVPSPNPGEYFNPLYAVTSASATDAWAVGSFYDAQTSRPRPLNAHWDGTSWTRVKSAGPQGRFGSTLNGAVMTGTNDVWAVGGGSPGHYIEPLIQHWDGTAWTTL